MLNKWFMLWISAIALLFTAACASVTEEQPEQEQQQTAAENAEPAAEKAEPERVLAVDPDLFRQWLAEPASFTFPEQNIRVIVPENFAGYFKPAGDAVFFSGSDGKNFVRVDGLMNKLPFFEWLITPEGVRPYHFCFAFQTAGGITFSPVLNRLIEPGDPARFSAEAPAGCTRAVLLLSKGMIKN